MWFYRALKRNVACDTITLDTQYTGGIIMPKLALVGDGTTGTIGTAIQIGTTAVPIALDTAGQTGIKAFFSSTATSDTTYGMYLRLDATGAGVEAIAGRFKTTFSSATTGQAYGIHATVEPDASTGKITGQCAAVLGNLVMANRDFGSGGTYYGVLGQVYPAGSTMSAGKISCLGANCVTGTGIDTKCAAISFDGADGSTKMIYTHNPGNTFTGSVKVLVNGAVRYLYTATNE
jgi:hypothetical protein